VRIHGKQKDHGQEVLHSIRISIRFRKKENGRDPDHSPFFLIRTLSITRRCSNTALTKGVRKCYTYRCQQTLGNPHCRAQDWLKDCMPNRPPESKIEYCTSRKDCAQTRTKLRIAWLDGGVTEDSRQVQSCSHCDCNITFLRQSCYADIIGAQLT